MHTDTAALVGTAAALGGVAAGSALFLVLYHVIGNPRSAMLTFIAVIVGAGVLLAAFAAGEYGL